jgi:PAS domain S-box-containing protein
MPTDGPKMNVDDPHFAATLIAAMPDAVIYADADGVIRLWNRGAERVFGYTAAEAIGQSLDLIIPENLRARHWAGYRRTTETGQSRYGEGALLAVPARRKDGARISVEFTIVPFPADDGHIAGIAAMMRDVTARFEEMRELRKEVEALRGGGVSPDSRRNPPLGSTPEGGLSSAKRAR